jgi:hypothetical protein
VRSDHCVSAASSDISCCARSHYAVVGFRSIPGRNIQKSKATYIELISAREIFDKLMPKVVMANIQIAPPVPPLVKDRGRVLRVLDRSQIIPSHTYVRTVGHVTITNTENENIPRRPSKMRSDCWTLPIRTMPPSSDVRSAVEVMFFRTTIHASARKRYRMRTVNK